MKQFISFLLAFAFLNAAFAQKDPTQMTDKRIDEVSSALKKDANGWKRGGDLGINLSGLGILNPRLSDGANQLGLGGIINLFANQKGTKAFWENSALLQLGALRTGGKDNPFAKNGDIFRLNSTWGYAVSGEKLFVAIDGRVETPMLKTYQYNSLRVATNLGDTLPLISQLFSPVSFMLAPGMVYKPNADWSFFVSPVAADLIYVANDDLAKLAGEPLGNENGKNSRMLIGPSLRAKYTKKFLSERIAFNSSFGWNGNYKDGLNGRALWANQMNIQLFKGFGLKLTGEAFYDHYQLATLNAGETDERLGYGTTYRGGWFLTYGRIF
ncbi:MAG: DUF3078 domain-containing protein [Saprospiraceae bacterium]|nr:DUF3078 domain-containing protein [Saprospiraceae bacterium]